MSQLPLNFPPSRKQTAMNFTVARPQLFRDDFAAWLDKNFHVWERFELEANRVWERGRTHYSARRIGEFIRHETALAEAPNEHGFKVNDHYWPDLGRLYVCFYPERTDFFERRPGQSAVRAA